MIKNNNNNNNNNNQQTAIETYAYGTCKGLICNIEDMQKMINFDDVTKGIIKT